MKKVLSILRSFYANINSWLKRRNFALLRRRNLKSTAILASFVLVALLALTLSYFSYHFYQSKYKRNLFALQEYVQSIYSLERSYVEGLPIYSDYITVAKAKQLRTYLLPYHLKAVRSRNAVAIQEDKEIEAMIAQNKLLALEQTIEPFFFFYNVPKKYRYLSPQAKQAVLELGRHFQQLLRERQLHWQVKLAISSILRPVKYQSLLEKRNTNAALVSSHSYGESFDIFFDEFYVVLPEVATENVVLTPDEISFVNKLRKRFGFLLGQSLRRQFRTVLTEAILQLQEEKKIYAILEEKQRCYHITARSIPVAAN